MSDDRCPCGFYMPGPMHARECRYYERWNRDLAERLERLDLIRRVFELERRSAPPAPSAETEGTARG